MTSPATCRWHPDRETGLRCGACGEPMCTECMRPHPVGIRCKECGAPAPLPTHAVSPSYILRGVGAAVNQRRGPAYQWMAAGGVAIAVSPIALAALANLSVGALINLAGVAVAVGVAWTRLAR